MTSKYIKLHGNPKTYELVSISTLPGYRVQLVVKDEENVQYVFTRVSGGFTYVDHIKVNIKDIEDS